MKCTLLRGIVVTVALLVASGAPAGEVPAVLAVGLVFGAINLPSVSVWTVLGQAVARVLSNPRALRLFNWTMAALLIASLWPVLRF